MKKYRAKRPSINALKTSASKYKSLPNSIINNLPAKVSELEAKLKRYQELVENVDDVLVDIDSSGHVIYVSPNVKKYLGYKPEELIGTIPNILMPPEESAERYSHFLGLASEGKKIDAMEMTYFHKDGHRLIVEAYAVPYFGDQGQLLGYLGVVRDITKRKRTEQAVCQSEENHRRPVQNTTAIILRVDLQGRITFINDFAQKLFCYSADEIIGKHSIRTIIPELESTGRDLVSMFDLIIADPDSFHTNRNENIKKTGERIWVEWTTSGIFDHEGQLREFLAVGIDITERKRIEEALNESNKRFRIYFETPIAGMAITSPDKGWIEVNDKICSLLGYSRKELTNMTWSEITHPDDLADDIRHFNNVLSGEIDAYSLEKRFIRKDGEIIWTNLAVGCLRNPDSSVKQFAATLLDISERKQADEKLRAKESELQFIANATPIVLTRIDKNLRYVFVNDALAEMFGLSKECIIGKKVIEIIGKDAFETIRPNIKRVLKGERLSFEIKIPCEKLEPRYMHCEYIPEINEQGEITGWLATLLDITERKQMEKLLREREERFRTAFDKGAVPMVLTALDGRLMLVNPAFCKMVGYRESELVGMNIYEFTHRDYFPENKYGIDAVVKGEKDSFRMEKRYICKDGRVIWVDMSTASVRDDDGKPLYLVTHVQDVTIRKQAGAVLRMAKSELEQKVSERTSRLVEINLDLVKEMEKRKLVEEKLLLAQQNLRAMASEITLADERSRKNFAADLHDTVVQTLGAAKIKAQLVQSQIPKKARPLFDDFLDMLTRSLVQTRSIISEMSPPVLNELGLIPALEWLTEQFRKQHGINVRFESNKQNVSLAHDIKVFLFQATRELLMNIVKHAKASSALVKFSKNGKEVSIHVSDDGQGFGAEDAFRPELKGSYGLYSIRERLQHMGGELTIESMPGQGTTIHVIAPRAIEYKIP